MRVLIKALIMLLLPLLAVLPASAAELRVVATVPNMGMLVRTIGGESVEVRVLAPADRDAHYLEARPAMMAALRRADLVVSVGAELEVGWLPAALQGSHNPNIQTGRAGHFEGANHTDLIQVGGAADRALGDVHVAGNPHYYMDPLRMAAVGRALAERLADLHAEGADRFRANAEAFADRAEQYVREWQDQTEDAPGVVFYHKDADYLAKLLGVSILGYIEPLPGIPPTARHLRELVANLREADGVILYADFHPSQGPEFLARELDWSKHQLPAQVGMDAGADDYFEMLGRWVRAIQR
jgi:zinc/manganese transport system substrate-binding protein